MTTIQTPNTSTTASSTQNSVSNSRWDHSGFDQLQQEENSGEWHHVQRPQKKKPAKSSTTDKKTSGGSRRDKGGRRGAGNKDSNTGNNVLSDEKGSDSLKFEDSHKAKKEKRPDRLLYNPRKNRQETDGTEVKDNKKTVPSLGLSKDNCEMTEMVETPTKIQQENEKNSPSNVSTAMSDRQKNFEEETSGMSSQVNSHDDGALLDSNLLFTMCFETERGLEMVPIYKDERDYEEFLNELCGAQRISSELEALHFKINLMKVIKEMHPEPARVEECLDKLLDRNYELLTSNENDFENAYESYEEESYDFPAGIDWNRNAYINTSSSQA